MNTEIQNISENNNELVGEGSVLEFRCKSPIPNQNLSAIKEVMIAIASKESNNWPDDQEWHLLLPQWFVKKITSYTIEQLYERPSLLWDFGSWLDAMKFRGWVWLSSEIKKDEFIIRVIANDFPYSVNPLEYLIYESGVAIEDIHFAGEQ